MEGKSRAERLPGSKRIIGLATGAPLRHFLFDVRAPVDAAVGDGLLDDVEVAEVVAQGVHHLVGAEPLAGEQVEERLA